MKIAETFYSIQAHGKNIGKPAFFILTIGNNLMTDFYNKEYQWKKGKEINIETLAEEANKYPRVVICGGEPLLQPELKDLLELIRVPTEVETNGSLYIEGLNAELTISPKIQYMNMNYRYNLEKWILDYRGLTFEYFIDKIGDVFRYKNLSEELGLDKEEVILTPQGEANKVTDLVKVISRIIKNEWDTARVIPPIYPI